MAPADRNAIGGHDPDGAERAGGHLIGVDPLTVALPSVLEVGYDVPVLAAGGVAESAEVQRLLDDGGTAVAGTRSLLTEESLAHPKQQRHQGPVGGEYPLFVGGGFGRPLRQRVRFPLFFRCDTELHQGTATAASRLAQYLHLVASMGKSAALHSGHIRVGCGSPNTVVPRRLMKTR